MTSSPDRLRILIAEDDDASGLTLSGIIEDAGWSPILVTNGRAALEQLTHANPPAVALLDWEMPDVSGLDICRRVRRLEHAPFLIMVTGRSSAEHVVEGLDAGADDYVVKPVKAGEICARVRTGIRTLELRNALTERVRELEAALARVQQLESLLPICSYCRRIREGTKWHTVESFLGQRAAVRFSHGCCPQCLERVIREMDATEASS